MQTSSEHNLMDWIAHNKKMVLGGVSAIVLITLGLGIRQNLAEKKILAASAALHDAEQKLEKELKVAGTTPIADVDRQLTETVGALKKVSTEFAGLQAAWEAQFQLGDLYSKHEPRSGKAIPAFEAAISSAPSIREKVFALYSLAYAYEKQGKFDEAIQQLDSAIKLDQPYFKAEISLSRARLLARSGKVAEADKAFEQVSKDFANTDLGRKADQWKAMRSL
jgi:tetratricopeptide (TPR) repeat protein